MKSKNTHRSLALLLAFFVGAGSVTGCAVEPSDEAGADALETKRASKIDTNVTSFEGTFTLDVGGLSVPYSFTMSDIDWTKKTARWDAKVTSEDAKNAGAKDDVGLSVAWNTARCDCVEFGIRDEKGASRGTLRLEQGELVGVRIISFEATETKLRKITRKDGSVWEARASALVDPTVSSFSGRFNVDVGGMFIPMSFSIRSIDWEAHTARWDANVLSAEAKSAGATDDVDYSVKWNQARCDCVSFDIFRRNGARIGGLKFEQGELTGVDYGTFSGFGERLSTVVHVDGSKWAEATMITPDTRTIEGLFRRGSDYSTFVISDIDWTKRTATWAEHGQTGDVSGKGKISLGVNFGFDVRDDSGAKISMQIHDREIVSLSYDDKSLSTKEITRILTDEDSR